jgi:alanyl aminopeptidase
MLVGKDTKQRAAYFTHIAAHEIAHQWFGNSVTPAWWDDLWLSESFASFVGDKIAGRLGAFDERPLNAVLERRDALDADARPDALPLRRPIANNSDPDNAFDAIAYQKGEAVLATFEALVGEDAFRDALRGYVKAHRDRSATTFEFVAALAAATTPALGKAFEQYATQAGAPIVDLALRCDGNPALVATARDGRFVPMCIAYPGTKRTCALVGDKTELPLGASCPAWLDANAAAGYYTAHWRDRSPTQWLAKLSPPSRVIVGDDLAATFRRGELPAADAVRELRTLLAGNLETQLAALALAREIDAVVDDAARPAWSAWLARRVPRPKRIDRASVLGDLVRELSALLLPADRLDKEQQRKARTLADKIIADDRFPDRDLVAAVADRALFDRLIDKARATQDGNKRERWLSLLGELPAAFAAPTAALVDDMAELPVDPIWDALAAYFENPAARVAAWQALHAHLDTFMKRAAHHGDDMIDAAGLLCDPTSRGEVATAFAPYLARVPAGRSHLDAALAAIDRCIARRGKIGDLAAAITTSR